MKRAWWWARWYLHGSHWLCVGLAVAGGGALWMVQQHWPLSPWRGVLHWALAPLAVQIMIACCPGFPWLGKAEERVPLFHRAASLVGVAGWLLAVVAESICGGTYEERLAVTLVAGGLGMAIVGALGLARSICSLRRTEGPAGSGCGSCFVPPA